MANDYTPSEGRRGTGVYAPRRITPTKNIVGAPPSASDWQSQHPNYVAPSYRGVNTADSEAQKIVDAYLASVQSANTSSTSGGGGGNPYTNAIKILQKQLSGGQYGTSYDNLSTLLGTTSGNARGQIDQATADAIAQINSRDGMSTPINYSAETAQIPQTALSNYLNSIGASTGSVDAGRNFLQGIINTSAQGASQSMASDQQAYAAQRQAAIDALTGNQQYQQGNLATSTQAQMLAIASAKEKERKALEDQILQYVLRGGRA
jgi:hypothetical protein